MDKKEKSEQRLLELVQAGLSSPIEPDDSAFWRKRREALRRAIKKAQQSKTSKLSS